MITDIYRELNVADESVRRSPTATVVVCRQRRYLSAIEKYPVWPLLIMTRLSLAFLILLTVSIAFIVERPVPVNGQQASLAYRLVLDQASANAGLAPVKMTYQLPTSAVIKLVMHSNAGGWYDVYDVRDFRATNEKGDLLQVQYTVSKDQQQAWSITVGSAQTVTVQYMVYLRYFDEKTGSGGAYMGYLAPDCLLAWAGWIFLLPSGYSGRLSVSFDLPQGWTAIAPWEKHGDSYETFGGEEFSKSTIGVGPFMTRTMTVAGSDLTVAVHSSFSPATADRIFQYAQDAFAYIVHAFGGQPPSPYVVVYTPFPQGRRNDFIEAYNSNGDAIPGFGMYVMYSFAHRLVHTFNGFSPTGTRTATSSETWFIEGSDVYYDSKVPFALGYRRDLNYMKDYLKEYEGYYGTSGDLALASAADLAGSEGRSDRFLSLIYHKSALVCMLLDSIMMRVTTGAKSFDALFQEMYRRYGDFRGSYSTYDIQQIASTISGFGFQKFFASYVTGKAKLPLRSDAAQGISVNWDELSAELGTLPGQPAPIPHATISPFHSSPYLSFSINGSSFDIIGLEPAMTGQAGGSRLGTPGSSVKAVYAVTDKKYLYVMVQMWGPPDPNNDYIFPVGFTGNGHWDYSFGFNMEYVWMYNLTGLKNGEFPDSRLSRSVEAICEVGDIAEIAIPLSVMGNPSRIAEITFWINQNGRTIQDIGSGSVIFIPPKASTTTTMSATSATETVTSEMSTSLTPPQTTTVQESETTRMASVQLVTGILTADVLVILGLTVVVLAVASAFVLRRRGK